MQKVTYLILRLPYYLWHFFTLMLRMKAIIRNTKVFCRLLRFTSRVLRSIEDCRYTLAVKPCLPAGRLADVCQKISYVLLYNAFRPQKSH